MAHPGNRQDREDDSTGIWVLRGVVLFVGLLILVNVGQTVYDAIELVTGGQGAAISAEARELPDRRLIREASRRVHADCLDARTSVARWVAGAVERLDPRNNDRRDNAFNCVRCGKSLELATPQTALRR